MAENPVAVVFKASNRQEYIEAVKSSFVAIAKRTVLSALVSAAPFMAWGPLPYLSGLFVEWVLVKAANGAETGIFFMFVDFRVAVQHKDFEAAAIKNYRIQQTGTKEEKDAAEKELVAAVDAFVKFNRL